MSCPFRKLWPAPAAAAEAATSGAGAPSGPPSASSCPFSGKEAVGAAAGGAPSEPAATAGEGAAAAASARGACVAAGDPSTAQQQQGGLQPATPPGAADAAGQCPFLAGVRGVAVAADAAAQAALPAASARCPVTGLAADGSTAGVQPSAASSQQQNSDRAEQASAGAAAAAAASQPAVCPLGFGGGQQPKLGQFHCLICKSLYHDCVVTACGHRYCAGCIARCGDCPICGADVKGVRPDAETRALVDRYIDAHAGNHTIWELEGHTEQGVDGLAGERSRASFLLQLGLRSMAAGNVSAARHRFQRCAADLQQQLDAARQAGDEASSATQLASLHCRLGAVSGCLGDCCRAEGDAAGTLSHYQRSVELLQAAGEDAEAQQALSVALSKVGELHHLQGDLAGAAQQYRAALQLRRRLLEATQRQWQRQSPAEGCAVQPPAASSQAGSSGWQGSSGQEGSDAAAAQAGAEACCSAALDLAASCLKLSGARRSLGDDAEAEALLAEAEQLLEQMEPGLLQQPALLQRKHASLAQFAGMLRQ